ncbi:hypothetical protein EYS09_24820 [Streptomyces kasugaensis]|uniref:Uncharacterized protein n=1 Tax=Streptomyces kasugaensis TaxID=1946 RepID=A0A4Q9HR99_STRKA|nr:hypothetical protein [Streptomyces kasugaensis]TBO57029.1 hypothetical protein EYS09_24820 [Streptomyces kasugaensis]
MISHGTLSDIRQALVLLLDWAETHPDLPFDAVEIDSCGEVEIGLLDTARLYGLADWAEVMPAQDPDVKETTSSSGTSATHTLTATVDDVSVSVDVTIIAPATRGEATA